MHRIIPVLFSFILCLQSKAQYNERLAVLDSLTYAQYYTEQWKPLLGTADLAIKNNQDFYWLYIRAAYAAQQLNKPYKEFYYLSKAYKKFPADALVQTRLYTGSFITAQYNQSLKLNRIIRTDSTLKPYYPKLSKVHLVNAEGGMKYTSDTLYDPMHYAQAGLGFRVKDVALYSAVTYMRQKLYYGDMQQYQLYISAAFSTRNNWQIVPVLHLIRYDISGAPTYIDRSKLTDEPYTAGVQVSRLYKNMLYAAGVYYSTLGKQEQLQVQPCFTWFPLSNNKLYFSASGNYLTGQSKVTVSGSAGYMPFNKLSLSIAYLAAQTRYYTEQNGFVVNNSYDITKNRYMASFSWRLFPSLSIYGIYQYETKTETYFNVPYNYHTGILGMKKLF
ncbi:MAG: hypothetical protein V4658_06085 [Bacteroidota bacterium]